MGPDLAKLDSPVAFMGMVGGLNDFLKTPAPIVMQIHAGFRFHLKNKTKLCF